MTNHPNRSKVRYLRYCPRGFANEVVYYRVGAAEMEAAEAFASEVNDDPSASAVWTNDAEAKKPGVAVDWADRGWQ